MKKNVFKKLLAIVLVFAMLAPVMGYLGRNMSEVQAEEEEKTVGYVIVPSSAVTITEPTDKTQPKVMYVKADDDTYGQYADYIFAGWYTDEAATIAAASGTTEKVQSGEVTVYARFVPTDVLRTKVQVTNGIVTNTTNENYKGKYVMRFVSSVDTKDYEYAGFEVSYNDKETNEEVTLASKTYKVFKRIGSTTGETANEIDTYNFSPKVVDTKSEYFITGKWPVSEEDKAVNYTVKAYWVTKDGTKVYGRERCVSVEDGTGATSETRLNLTVDVELSEDITYTATYTAWNAKKYTDNAVEVLTSGNGYSNIRVSVTDKNLKSVTLISILSEEETITTSSYRNLYSKYEVEDADGNMTTKADGTWYSADEDECIIATRADMYGFANLVDSGESEYSFKNKKIYLVSDIALNPEELEMLEGDNYLKWYTYDEEGQKVYQDAPSFNWNPIGKGATADNCFYGLFDGQGHTISGLYLNMTDSNNSRFGGLFSQLNTGANIKNVKLKRSYLKTVGNSIGGDIGSVAGVLSGTLDTVYSDAIVESTGARSGGMVGQASGTAATMTNCWYAGQITNSTNSTSNKGTGGLVGTAVNSSVLTMKSCLNTGIVDCSVYTDPNSTGSTVVVPMVGGLVGEVKGQLNLSDSLNVGEIQVNAKATAGYGSIVGYGDNKITASTTFGAGSSKASGGKTISGLTSVADKSLIGADAQTNMNSLAWKTDTTKGTWTTVEYGIPVLTAFENEVFDTSWYDDNKNIYLLKDMGDFYGLASLATEIDFTGKTVKLKNDIIVNAGNATDWKTGDVPYYTWSPIGSQNLPFAGIFDGDGHSISGIYLNTTSRWSGLFGTTANNAKIQNLKLKNSYMKTTAADFGSIAGVANGEFHTIYTDAIVDCVADRSGGMFGQASGTEVVMTKCWFDGTLTNSTGTGTAIGGIVGVVANDTKLTMTSCYNTGQVDVSAHIENQPYAGGIVGRVGLGSSGELILDDSLNVGIIKLNAEKKFTNGYGALVGIVSSNAKSTITDTYGTEESCSLMITVNSGGESDGTPESISSLISGQDAMTSMPYLSWNESWTTTENLPVLTVFMEEAE